jgi:single-stranded DNA-binding protein
MGRGGRDEVGYINVSASGPAAKPPPHLSKGWLVAVDGRLQWSEWEPTKDGTRRHDYEIVGNVEFLTAPRKARASRTAQHADEPEEALAF